MNNAWLPSTKVVPKKGTDPSGYWQWEDISGNEHQLLRDSLGSDKWGSIRSYDMPIADNKPLKIYTGCQIKGRSYNYDIKETGQNSISSGSWVTNLSKDDLYKYHVFEIIYSI